MAPRPPTDSEANWFNKRSYAHFDLPLAFEDAASFVTDPAKVARHGFYPFLAFDMTHRRFRGGDKVRPICMAAHLDGYIFAYYARMLADAYEVRVTGTPISTATLAYRRGLGSNINFADAAFREIEKRACCVAIALDIKSFFDRIDHTKLKQSWTALLGVSRLPPDHFAVYRAVTNYALVGRAECYEALGIKDRPRVPRPLCSPRDFRDRIRGSGLVNIHTDPFGIPQGSQISAVLSNVYMLPFDAACCSLSARIGAYYRRYSDDILWICDPSDVDDVLQSTGNALKEIGSELIINDAKTVSSTFVRRGDAIHCIGRPLQYLGFEFDGERRLVRSSTMSRYWRNVIVAVRAVRRRAERAERTGGNPVPFRRTIYRKFTHLGRSNFVRYALRSGKQMRSNAIRHQIAGHWDRVRREFEKSLKS